MKAHKSGLFHTFSSLDCFAAPCAPHSSAEMWQVTKLVVLCILIASLGSTFAKDKDVTELQIGVKHKPSECPRKTKPGDTVHVHYTGKLVNGEVFDSSHDRKEPIVFELGAGRVIKGWDQGLLNMCVGEKRKLKIPPHLGYGESGAGAKIPGSATLIFETELVEIAEQ